MGMKSYLVCGPVVGNPMNACIKRLNIEKEQLGEDNEEMLTRLFLVSPIVMTLLSTKRGHAFFNY